MGGSGQQTSFDRKEVDCQKPPRQSPGVTSDQKPPGWTSLCLCVLKGRLWLLPIFTAGWLFSAIWISYGIAVYYNHVEPDFPWISYTAIEAPERCWFGQMVNIGAVMLGLNMVFRYLFVKNRLLETKTEPDDCLFKVNIAGLFLGISAALGLSMVANFQTDVLQVPNLIGAALAFVVGGIYCAVQTCLSYKVINQSRGEIIVVILQIINSIALWLILIIFLTTIIIVKYTIRRNTKMGEFRSVYLASTITEWLLAFSILTFTLTFIPNFINIRLYGPKIIEKEKNEKKDTKKKKDKLKTGREGAEGSTSPSNKIHKHTQLGAQLKHKLPKRNEVYPLYTDKNERAMEEGDETIWHIPYESFFPRTSGPILTNFGTEAE